MLPLEAGDDASRVQWMDADVSTEPRYANLYASHRSHTTSHPPCAAQLLFCPSLSHLPTITHHHPIPHVIPPTHLYRSGDGSTSQSAACSHRWVRVPPPAHAVMARAAMTRCQIPEAPLSTQAWRETAPALIRRCSRPMLRLSRGRGSTGGECQAAQSRLQRCRHALLPARALAHMSASC